MPSYTNLFEEVLEAWTDVRLGVLNEARNIPGEHWDFRPTPDVKSVRELVVHILEAAMFMTGELSRPDTNFRRAPIAELAAMYAQPAYDAETREDLLELLESQLSDGLKAFNEAGELHMLQFIKRFDGKQGTRLAWMNHGISHEEYHRGQLTTYARLLGLVPALTRLIHASK